MTEAHEVWHIATLFERVAAAVPDRPAVVSGARTLSFHDLGDRADRLARVLVDRGIRRADWIALCLRNGTEYLEATLAALKIGAVPVNVNYRYTAPELRYVFADADARAVAFHRSFTDVVAEASSELPNVEVHLAVNDGDRGTTDGAVDYEAAVTSRAPLRLRDRYRSGSDPYVMYTGGTTGMPKGVLWQQSDLIKGVLLAGGRQGPPATVDEVVQRAQAGGRRVVVAAPLMHGLGQWLALGSLLAGNTVVLDDGRHFDPQRLWTLAADEGAAVIGVAGDAMAGPLADALPEVGSLDLSALKVVYSSAAMLSPAVRAKLLAALPHIRIVDAYGSSETGPHAQARAAATTGPGEAGRFVVDHRTSVLDDAFRPVEPGSGAVGWVARTGHIAVGYHKDSERTARTFPVIDGVRWCVSGDAATVEADGTIRLLGRGTACINSGGEKIYPDEVEAALKAHPQVLDAVVVGLPDPRFGERVVAVVSSRAGKYIATGELDHHVRQTLAGYKVPRAYCFVPQVRRSPAGKPDYTWARDEAAGQIQTPAARLV